MLGKVSMLSPSFSRPMGSHFLPPTSSNPVTAFKEVLDVDKDRGAKAEADVARIAVSAKESLAMVAK